MVAVRVMKPETPQEVELLTQTPNPQWPLFRVTIWGNQKSFFGYWNGEVLLGPVAYLQLRSIHPSHWVELLRVKS